MKLGVLHRKTVSAGIRLTGYLRNVCFYIKMRLLGINIQLGENISVGRMVTVRTTDGGSIILEDGVSLDNFVNLYAQCGRLVVGKNSYIGIGCHLIATDSVRIGKHCLVAAYSIIRDADHGMEQGMLISEQQQCSSPILIGDDVWLGSHVVVTAGCTIGTGAVIGANAVVTKEIPSLNIAGGVPATVIRAR